MPKSERDEVLAQLTSRIFNAMVNDLIMDVTLQSHHEVARSRAVCDICKTRCGSAHVPTPSTSSSQNNGSPSRAGTPALVADGKPSNGGSGSGTPTSTKDGNTYLECVVCSRQIASNRYAPHLSNCMGLSSARRGAARGVTRTKQQAEAGRSMSPGSDMMSDESPKKGKGKLKRTEEAEFSLKRKRNNSPQISPGKNQKKQKTGGSPAFKLKGKVETPKPYLSPTQLKKPSKLRESSTASFIGGSSGSSSSRESSPEAALAATPASSLSGLGRSPNVSTNSLTNGKFNSKISKTVKMPGTAHRPPPIHVPDYTIEVDGEETGSSTDTDSN